MSQLSSRHVDGSSCHDVVFKLAGVSWDRYLTVVIDLCSPGTDPKLCDAQHHNSECVACYLRV